MPTDRPRSGKPDTAAAATTSIPVVLVDDSRVSRRFLRSALESTPEFEVVGEASNGREAVAQVERLRPAAVLMDLDLPIMNGMEAIERIMAIRPTPIVVYSAFVDADHSANVMEALAAGAVDVFAKPEWGEGGRLDEHADELRRRLRVAARVKVITHPRGRLRGADPGVRDLKASAVPALPAEAPPAQATAEQRPVARTAVKAPGPASTVALPDTPSASTSRPDRRRATEKIEPRTTITQLVAIGASTGGPQALATVLSNLPADFSPAILVVQHMAEGFIPGLVSWLDGLLALRVVQGESGRRLQPGTITVAPSGRNLLVQTRLRVVCEPAPAKQFHIPGIDASFTSVAEAVGAEAVGVLLTGMGRDGAVGLKAMRDRGATTLGQDEATSAVYGMPQAGFELGAVEHQLPIGEIGPALLTLVQGTSA
ncbi:MAG TPA: chemotaxis-specific protein-glutamate methyltransferase CheB [Mycobacteriales bacterium]|nr:chemotaxis-specific protein-glutamate methyltransferase CheB [Mycobacteriales bacterium]